MVKITGKGIILLMFFLDFIFVLSNLIKIADGAWYALLIAMIASLFMWMQIKRR
jgi:K+ transporter